MVNNVLILLKKARELISEPSRWTQGSYARDRYNRSCSIVKGINTPVSWCSAGALCQIHGTPSANGEAYRALQKTCMILQNKNLLRFNDLNTHSDIITMWDKTIQRLENEHAIA